MNPLELWEEFKEELAYDFIWPEMRKAPEDRTPNYRERAIERAYKIIAGKLEENATEGRTFDYWVRHYGFPPLTDFEEEPDYAVPLAPDEGKFSFLIFYYVFSRTTCPRTLPIS